MQIIHKAVGEGAVVTLASLCPTASMTGAFRLGLMAPTPHIWTNATDSIGAEIAEATE